MDDDPIGYIETMLQRYLPGLDVSTLTDAQFARKYAQLNDILKKENKPKE